MNLIFAKFMKNGLRITNIKNYLPIFFEVKINFLYL